jgi:hypothetical protein
MNIASLFYDYVDVDGNNIIKAWLDVQPKKVKAKITDRLTQLEQIDRIDWHHTLYTETLKGDKDGLVSVKALFRGVQYRLLGYDGPNRGEFTLLAPCKERNDRYEPLNVGQIAFKRRDDVQTNPVDRRIRHVFG